MSDLGELKFPVAAHHRLICDVGRRNEAAMKWHLRGTTGSTPSDTVGLTQ